MDHDMLREKSVEFDIESRGNTNEEDCRSDLASTETGFGYILSRVWSGHFSSDQSIKPDCCIESSDSSVKSNGVVEGNVTVPIERSLDRDEMQENYSDIVNKNRKQKKHKTNSRTPPSPPRGPSLDAADQKLVKEIAELAMKKRARMERMKTPKNKKTAKAFSSVRLSATIFTIFSLLVIFFQGMNCGRSLGPRLLIRSPEPAFDGSEGLISIQHYIHDFAKQEALLSYSQ